MSQLNFITTEDATIWPTMPERDLHYYYSTAELELRNLSNEVDQLSNILGAVIVQIFAWIMIQIYDAMLKEPAALWLRLLLFMLLELVYALVTVLDKRANPDKSPVKRTVFCCGFAALSAIAATVGTVLFCGSTA